MSHASLFSFRMTLITLLANLCSVFPSPEGRAEFFSFIVFTVFKAINCFLCLQIGDFLHNGIGMETIPTSIYIVVSLVVSSVCDM